MTRVAFSRGVCACGATTVREIEITAPVHVDATAFEIRSTTRRCVKCRRRTSEGSRAVAPVLIGSPELLAREDE